MESWKYLIKMVILPRVHGYNPRIDIEEILVTESGGWYMETEEGFREFIK